MERLTIKDKLEFSDRLSWVTVLFVCLLGLVWVRMIQLQVVRGGRYRQQAMNNSLRIVKTRAPRGIIFDRAGRVLARNNPSYTVSIVPAELRPEVDTVKMVSDLLGLEESVVRAKITSGMSRRYELLTVKEYVPKEVVAKLEERAPELPGVVVHAEPRRFYREGPLAASVIGFVSEVSEDQVFLAPDRFAPGDTVGQMGIERALDMSLRGMNGMVKILVNARGHELQVVSERAPRIGVDCVLTIDVELQRTAEDLLRGKRGACVALDPRTGDVLALVSAPTIPLDRFNDRLTASDWRSILQHPDRPLVNRAVAGVYSPGSLLKPLAAIMAIEQGAVHPKEVIECRGTYWHGDWDYDCWLEGGHGQVDLRRAIAESCDVYFYQMGLRMKVDGLVKTLRAFGFGRPTGVELLGESSGCVPTPEWKQRQFDEPWFPGNTIQLAIGQGYLTATPVQMATAFCAMGNEGMAFRPRIVKRLGETDYVSDACVRLTAKTANWNMVKQAMWDVVNTPSGTGRAARIGGLDVCGKTATIQYAGSKKNTHAAFACFAPRAQPEIVLVVLVEDGGTGGTAAAPLAQRFLTKWQQWRRSNAVKSEK